MLVAAPTTAARDDAQYLLKRLKALRVSPRALILNSAYVPENEWIEVLEDADLDSQELRSVLSTLREESEIRERASTEVAQAFSRQHPSLAQHRLPYVEVREPKDVVVELSHQLDVAHLVLA